MKFTYLLAAALLLDSSFASEDIVHQEPEGGSSNRYFKFGANLIPHPSKREKGGEDAFVAAHDLMIVADGVGGWARSGIDPGLFSKQLVSDFLGGFSLNNAVDLKKLLADSVEMNTNTGTCTFCAAKFDTSRPNYIRTINLGDSGYLLLRIN